MSSPVTEKVIVPDKVDDNNDDQDKVKEEEEKKGAEKDDEEDEVHVNASEASSVDDGDSKVSDGQSSGSTSEYESLDNDEDRRNPQYIPKRGAFYEHDDRIMSDEEEDKGDNDNNNSGNSNNINANNNNNDVEEEKSESQQPQPQQQPKAGTPVVEKGKKPKKKSTNDGAWGHDLFNDAEQKPKSRIEIINSYGYDIREEEGPPKARRRRKYGRGHTRNERPPRENVQGVKPPRRPPNPSSKQDFPDIAKAESKPEPRPVNKEVKNPKRAERVERVERTDRIERAERTERPERIERIERAERIERVERVERTEEPPVMVKTQVFKNSRRDPRDSRDSRREPIHPKDQAPRGDNFIRGKNRPKFEDRDFPSPRDGPRVEREAPSRESRGRLPRDIPQIHRDTGRPNRSSHQNDTIPPEDGPGDRGDRKNRYPNRWDRERDFKDRRNDHEIDRDRRRGDSYRTRGYHDDRGYEVEDARLTTGMGQISLNRHRSSDMRNDKVKPAHQEMNRYVNPVPRGSRENNNYNNNHSRDVQHMQSTNSHIADPRAPPTKRYSSLRQQQRQEQRVQQPPPKLPPTKQTTENVINNEQSQPSPPPPQPPLQQLNVNHQQRRPTSNSHFYDAQTGSAPSNYYPETRSPQSTYNYVPPNDMDQGRFPQMAPRPFIPSTAPPPSVPESRFLTQSVTSAPSPAALATIPHVLPGPPPGAAYLPTYPPGYPQFPPPPPPPAAQYSINVQGVPPTPPVNPDLYVASDMGTVYYDTVTQQVSPRQLPQRRPKNALPIVPPPSTTEADSDVYQGVETVT